MVAACFSNYVFLDVSKAFDKVWYEGIIFKLGQNGISGELSDLLCDFSRNTKQRLVLNRQISTWTNVNAGVPQGSILGPLGQVIFGDISSFSVMHNIDSSAAEFNNDLAKTRHWAHQWNMSFNQDSSKQAQEVIFSRKVNKDSHPTLTFNNNIVYQATPQKHLGIILDNRLSFEEHLRLDVVK